MNSEHLKIHISSFLRRGFTWIYGLCHKINRQVLFISFGGKQYSDSPRAISEELHRLYPGYRIIWALREEKDEYQLVPDYVQIIKSHSLEFYKVLSTSFCVVSNCEYGRNIYKRKGQFFIQTWHADVSPKKILREAAFLTEKADFLCKSVRDDRITDLCIAGSDFGESVYHTAFGYSGEILKIGLPRNSRLELSDLKDVLRLKRTFDIEENEKVLLYAPTFRDDGSERTKIDLKKVLHVLKIRTGVMWKCLYRVHTLECNHVLLSDSEKIIDVTSYPDMTDILLITDLLITDFSSSPADFLHKDGATILFLSDEKYYQDNCRNLKYDFFNTGFICARNQEELEKIILTRNKADFSESNNKIKKQFGIVSCSKSATIVARRIHEQYQKVMKR